MFAHRGYTEPYQLHCCTPEQTDADELLNARLLDDNTLDDDEREDEDSTEDCTDDDTTLERAEDAAELVPQIAPVTTGVSTAPLVATCNPNDTVCPGEIPPFQPRLVALYGLLPLTVAFQLPVTRLFT